MDIPVGKHHPAWLPTGPPSWLAAETVWLVGAICAFWVLASVASILLTPPTYLVGGLFAIPTLIAAHRLSPRLVIAVGVISIVLDIANGAVDPPPASAWLFNILAQVVIVYLGVQFASGREQSARREQEAEEARQSLQRFMGMVSHDMRDPLFTVMARAQLLAECTQDDARDDLRAIEVAAYQMRRFADDLVDAARIGAGHFEIDSGPMDLVIMLRELVDGRQSRANGLQLVLNTPPAVEGRWDHQRVRQLFGNLISNAIKYSPAGGDVQITAAPAGDEVVVSVSDHGLGMTPDQMQLLFKPFSRVQTIKAAKGTGLGLYIAKAIAEAQGGRIWAESAVNQGSTFYVALPLPG